MKKLKRIISLACVLTIALGLFTTAAFAAGTSSPVSLSMNTSASAVGYNGIVTVTVTFKNTSGKDIKNIVITSCDSTGLCMYRPIDKNVVITNPGYAKPLTKKDATTTCLKPGGTIKYVYCVLLGYQYAKRIVPEATRKVMLKQHKLLHTKDFREISISGAPYKAVAKALKFGDVNTILKVKAYYNISNSVYDRIANGSSVIVSTPTATRSSSSNSATGSSSGIRPEFKEFWDSYVNFWIKWSKIVDNPTASNYSSMSKEYESFVSKEKYFSPENASELAYMLEAQERMNKM